MTVKSPFRYPGGKSKQAGLILQYMPYDTLEYREAFVGGGGVYFGLDADRVKKRWINDLNPYLIEVYDAFLNRPKEFIDRCREILPPQPGEEEVSTKGTGKKYNKRLGELFEKFKYNEDMDQALRYFFINRTVWAGRVNFDPAFESRLYYSNPNGWNVVKKDFLEQVAYHLWDTKVTCLDYSTVLKAPGEKVWIYLDPPYVVDTKLSPKSKLYALGFTEEDHIQFAGQCRECIHRIAISYDDVPEVRELFSDPKFHIYEHKWVYSGTSNEVKEVGKELIITNYPKPSYWTNSKPQIMDIDDIMTDATCRSRTE